MIKYSDKRNLKSKEFGGGRVSPFQGVMVEKAGHQDPEAAGQKAATAGKLREMNASHQFALLRYSLTGMPRGPSQVILDSVKLTTEIYHHMRILSSFLLLLTFLL